MKLTRELTVSQTAISRLKRKLKRLGISQEAVADESNVSRPMVNHVLNGRAKSRKVIAACQRLLANSNGRK
jgi:transcriptional regulator with XRE-family HTH domain